MDLERTFQRAASRVRVAVRFGFAASLIVALASCVDVPSTNPYDPMSADTVHGEVRLALILPDFIVEDDLYDPQRLAAALREIDVVAKPLDDLDTEGWRPVEAREDIRLDVETSDRQYLLRTLRAPAGQYEVTVSHRQHLFETETFTLKLQIGRRAPRREVELKRSTLGVGADFRFGASAPPADSWFELRALRRLDDDCVLQGQFLRRVPIDGVYQLGARDLDSFTARPARPYVCGLVGGPGFQVFSLTHETTVHGDIPNIRFVRAFAPEPTRVHLSVFGLPEARALHRGATIEAAERVPGPLGAVRLSGRLMLLRVRLLGLLHFAGGAEPLGDVGNRIRRIAVLDTPTRSVSIERGRFHPVDALPQSGDLPYIGSLDPEACLGVDPSSSAMYALLKQSDSVKDAIYELSSSRTERLLPVCLGGEGPILVYLQTEDDTDHVFEIVVEIDRESVGRTHVQVNETWHTDGRRAQRMVMPVQGRFSVRAGAEVTAHLVVTTPTPGEPIRVTAAVLPGELGPDGQWSMGACDGRRRELEHDDRVFTGYGGQEFEIPVAGLATPAPPAPDGPLRLQRNRVCFYIEDQAGNPEVRAIDVDTVDGRLEAQILPGAGSDERAWVRSNCRWPALSSCFAALPTPHIVDGRLTLQMRLAPESVDPSAHGPGDEVERLAYPLVSLTVETDDGRSRSHPPFVQNGYLSHDFDADGFHDLRVYGTDLIQRRVPFMYQAAGEAATETVTFLRDTQAPRVLVQRFLTCSDCQGHAVGCADACSECIENSFLVDDILLAPGAEAIPELPVISKLSVFGPDDEDHGLCAITEDASEDGAPLEERTHQMQPMCGNIAMLSFRRGEGGVQLADERERRPSPPEGDEQPHHFVHHVVDTACNVYRPDEPDLTVRFDDSPPTPIFPREGEEDPVFQINCQDLELACAGADGASACWRREPDTCTPSSEVAGEPAHLHRLLSSVRFALADPESIPFGNAPIRYRFFVASGLPPGPDETGSPCTDEPAWSTVEGPGGRRQASCAIRPGCRCARDAQALAQYFYSWSSPIAFWTGEGFVDVWPESHNDITPLRDGYVEPGNELLVLSEIRPYVLVEDAVGNRAVHPLFPVGRACAPPEPGTPVEAGCAETYTLPIHPVVPDEEPGSYRAVEVGRPAPWLEVRDCDANGMPTGEWRRPENLASIFCPAVRVQ